MSNGGIVIVGAGPYGLSLAAHLASKSVPHRIFGSPMRFWSQIAAAARERYLKSYCFGGDISTPKPGFSFADYNGPRGLETFEPCSMGNFTDYGLWFQQNNVPWVEPFDVEYVGRHADGYEVRLSNGEQFTAGQVVLATGLACFEHVPSAMASLPSSLCTHTSRIEAFSGFRGRSVAVVGAGQSALEAAALLKEAGASPQLLVRENRILWQDRVVKNRSIWRQLRSPITGLGTGPKAWALSHFPGVMHRLPTKWRTQFVKRHLPAEGAWWLRKRVENQLPVHFERTVVGAKEADGGVVLNVRVNGGGSEHQIRVDHVVAGSGYVSDVQRLKFLDPQLRSSIEVVESAPRLDATFESSAPGLRFIGPASAMSFGPLFRFVVGAEYSAKIVSTELARGNSSKV